MIGYELTLNEELKIEPYFLTVYDLSVFFSLFVSAARDEPPDIDVDFEHERREEVLQYLYEKYGRERVGMTAEASATTAARRCGM